MNILRSKYKELRATEISIKEELSKANKMPRLQVLVWLDEVQNLRNQAKSINKSLEYKGRRCIPKCHVRFSAIKLSRKMDQLRKAGHFPGGLIVPFTVIVDQCPDRSQLLGTIWENLMDPNVGIISIYGNAGVGKTTAMTKIRNQLSTSGAFNSIIWVSVSKNFSLHKLQNDIALQMNLDLPAQTGTRSTVLLESLQYVGKFLIIFDDLWEPISLTEVGIPLLDRADGCKIALITRDFDVCRSMQSDKFIRVDPLSWTEKWDLFVEKAGNSVLAPEIRPFARQVVEICPGLPFIVTSTGHAMRDETSVEAWRDVLVYLSTQMTHAMEGMVFKLLRICYTRLKNEIMQNCFLYCALFPEDHIFKSEELIRYWIGEAFIQKDRDLVSEMNEGRAIIRKLVDSNMLEMFTESGDDGLIMPHLCRNMAIKVMKEEPRFWVNENHGLQIFHCDMADTTKISSVIRFDTYSIWDQSPYISTLLLQHSPLAYPHDKYFCNMNALRFLDLSHSLIAYLPTSISKLAQLRVLLLHNCRRLKIIPTLENMEELQILNLQGTSIAELPKGMERMPMLRSLDLSETTNLKNIRVGLMSSLSGLEELRMQGSGVCKMDSPMVANYLREMRCLKQLAILTINAVRYDDLLDTIMCLQRQNLQIYSINLYGTTGNYNEDM